MKKEFYKQFIKFVKVKKIIKNLEYLTLNLFNTCAALENMAPILVIILLIVIIERDFIFGNLIKVKIMC